MRGWQKRTEKQLWNWCLGLTCLVVSGGAAADGRLAWTGGVSEIEGAAGGGLVPWALIAGLGTEDQIGGSAFVTGAETDKFKLKAGGLAVGLYDRVEVSFARQRFDINDVVQGLAALRATRAGKLPTFLTPGAAAVYPDVDGDGVMSINDVLPILVQIRRQHALHGEGSAADIDSVTSPLESANVQLQDLALLGFLSDAAPDKRKR